MATKWITNYRKDHGYLLPLALLLMVITSGVALLMLRQASHTTTSEVLSLMALHSTYTAEAAAELAANQLYFIGGAPALNRQQVDSQCTTLTNNPTRLLNQCTVTLTCECHYEDHTLCDSSNAGYYDGTYGVDSSFYRIISEARCGSGFAQGVYRHERIEKALSDFPNG